MNRFCVNILSFVLKKKIFESYLICLKDIYIILVYIIYILYIYIFLIIAHVISYASNGFDRLGFQYSLFFFFHAQDLVNIFKNHFIIKIINIIMKYYVCLIK